jgi:hypothetical protein
VEPWLLNSQSGDPIAYFYIADDKDGVRCIQADVSGRHSDSAVLDLLRELQRQLGGTVRDDT